MPQVPEAPKKSSVATDDDTVELHIDTMAYGGKGVGRIDGKVFFVLDAIVGDQLRVRVTKDSGRYADAEIVSLLSPSRLRGPSPCKFADRCGGCQWQGIDYDQQLEWKKSFVSSPLRRIGKLKEEPPLQTKPAPDVQGYRNRILLRARLLENGTFTVGYFQRHTRELVTIDRCEIAATAINHFIKTLLTSTCLQVPAQKFRFEIQEILPHCAGNLLITVYPGDKPAPGIEKIVNHFRSLPQVHWAGLISELKDAPMVVFDTGMFEDGNEDKPTSKLTFKTLPGQFQQVNVAHNHNLRELVRSLVLKYKPRRILDLCCGSGNLSLSLVTTDTYVYGVESNASAIAVAKQNMQDNSIRNALYVTGDSEKHLAKIAHSSAPFDLVILDPPRQGLQKGMTILNKIKPQAILYVSCDPTTLARDIAILVGDGGYKIASIFAFDFFPNTYHVETVVELCLEPR
jgi:23S rRNA (uracil1939-C5)-methyltransferase